MRHTYSGGMRGRYQSGPRRERSSFKHLAHLRKLLPYLRRYGWWFAVAILGLLIHRFGLAYVPDFMRTVIDSLNDPAIPPNYFWPAMGILAVVAVQFVIFVPARRILRRLAISVTYDLRKRLFNNVQYQGPGFFNKFNTGDLMSRAVNDVSQVRMFVSFGMVQIATFVFTLMIVPPKMFQFSPSLAIATLIPLPFVVFTGFLITRKIYPYFMERQEAMAEVTSFTQENLSGIRTIQAMAQEDQEIDRFRRTATHYTKKAYRASRFMAFMNLTMTTLTALSPLIVLSYGGYLVIQGDITIGVLQAFLGWLLLLAGSVSHIGWALSLFFSAAAGTERIFEIVSHQPEVQDKAKLGKIAEIDPSVQIRGLSYIYPEASEPAVNGVDMNVKSGHTVAFLGRMASGKSTILKAIVRLIDTPRDTIFIGDHDICDLPIQQLRKEIALVPQYAFLFSASVKENVSYDDVSRGDEVVWDATDAASMEETIAELSEGLRTIVGERGVTLSGGQKQRSTLARGLIRDSKVLLLDDVFSSVDTETEERIIRGLNRLRKDKTTILISHRVSTARHADYIYVFDDGKVIESGTHTELLARGGHYADLEAVQSNQDRDQSRRARLIRKLQEIEQPSEESLEPRRLAG